jgi:hypothetical protein
MTIDDIVNKMQEMFSEIADPEVFPLRFKYQFLLAKMEIEHAKCNEG